MPRSITRRLLGTVATVTALCCATIAEARTVSYSGPCPRGSACDNWVVVVTYDDYGNITDRAGVNCTGSFWRDHCSWHPVDPGGLPSTSDYLLTTDDGLGWIRLDLSGSGTITRMWGKTAGGTYWEADTEQPSFLQ